MFKLYLLLLVPALCLEDLNDAHGTDQEDYNNVRYDYVEFVEQLF